MQHDLQGAWRSEGERIVRAVLRPDDVVSWCVATQRDVGALVAAVDALLRGPGTVFRVPAELVALPRRGRRRTKRKNRWRGR